MKRCKNYVGTTCVNGYCPNVDMDGEQIKCDDCLYYEGCKDCIFNLGTASCDNDTRQL